MIPDPDKALEVHKRLLISLRHRTRTHFSIYAECNNNHSRHARSVDRVLAGQIFDLIKAGKSPSIIRGILHVGYGTINRAISIMEGEEQCQQR